MPMKPIRRRVVVKPVPAATPKSGKITWESAVAAFLDNGRDPHRRLSPATIENYTYYLLKGNITEFRKDHGITVPADMTAEKLAKLERELQDLGASAGTIGGYHRCLKNFVGFCIREGYGGDEQEVASLTKTLTVRGPKLGVPEMEKFTDAEIAKMRSVLAVRPRDLMLVNLMLATGLRLAEVAALTLDDLILDAPNGALIHVREGKGGKSRHIPLRDDVSAQLRRYVAKVRPSGAANRALFLTNRADAHGAPQPLSTSAIQTLFKRLSAETAVHINPHKFRHTFASRALSGGLDVMALKKALGHTTLEMVSRYVHKDTSDLQRAWAGWKD